MHLSLQSIEASLASCKLTLILDEFIDLPFQRQGTRGSFMGTHHTAKRPIEAEGYSQFLINGSAFSAGEADKLLSQTHANLQINHFNSGPFDRNDEAQSPQFF